MKLDWGLITTAAVIAAILIFLYRLEKSSFNSRQISLMAALIAFTAAGRMVTGAGMLFLQPTMFLPFVTGWVMGARTAFFVGAMTPLIANIFMGQGAWTPFQMLGWGLIGLSGAVLKRLYPAAGPVLLTIMCGFWGYFYGAIMDIWQWVTFIHPLTLQGYLVLWLAGFSFDSMRALGNLLFCGVLGAQTIKILAYYQKKMSIQYMEEGDLPQGVSSWSER